jgi:hypothetical protein
VEVKLINKIAQVDAADWNGLVGDAYPFLRHEFLLALEESLSVCEKTGWLPHHVMVSDEHGVLAVMPLYLKSHSRGEYVFDYQWAQAYHQTGRDYYPKWLTAVPFTPCQGPRWFIRANVDDKVVLGLFLAAIIEVSEENDISSWHCLFPTPEQTELLREIGFAIREGVQFQWFNKDYKTFDDFLQSFNASKRKMIKRERRKVQEQGIELLQLSGDAVSAEQWAAFFKFYTLTYMKNGNPPYLNLEFFIQVAKTMGDKLLLVFALKDSKYVGAALSVIGDDTLYGRYWGCYEEYNALHFEACYYQGLDYCIAHGLARFDSGAQGEHKIARGFEPVTTYSAHWLKDPEFAAAVQQFLKRERGAIELYKQDAANYLPFKKAEGIEK